MARPNNDQAHLRKLRDLYARVGFIPSYSEIASALGFSAKNAAFKLSQRLIESGHLTKSSSGRLAPGAGFFTVELSEDEVRAGFGADGAGTGLMQAQALEHLVNAKPSRTVLVRVRGESMVDAGILSGDVAVVETGRQAAHGDIVVAQIDGAITIKELRLERGRPQLVERAQSARRMQPKHSLNVIGVVRGIVRSYRSFSGSTDKLSRQGAKR